MTVLCAYIQALFVRPLSHGFDQEHICVQDYATFYTLSMGWKAYITWCSIHSQPIFSDR